MRTRIGIIETVNGKTVAMLDNQLWNISNLLEVDGLAQRQGDRLFGLFEYNPDDQFVKIIPIENSQAFYIVGKALRRAITEAKNEIVRAGLCDLQITVDNWTKLRDEWIAAYEQMPRSIKERIEKERT